jgi:hypothetical protein
MPDIENTPSIIDQRYAAMTGGEKRDYLFDAGIRATAYTNGLPDVHFGVVQFAEAAIHSIAHGLLRNTITRVGDELETPGHKLFHTYGTTAKVLFTPSTDTPYSGLFREVCVGLLRFSYAGPVVGVGIVPGLGLKLFVDGDHPSENAVMMRMLDPQSEHSVFEHPFTNILPDPAFTNLTMREVKSRFETVVTEGHGLQQPVLNFARVTGSGQPVSDDIRAPYRVILIPTADARRLSDPDQDFREDLARNVPSGTTIYEVHALDQSQDTSTEPLEDLLRRSTRIGTLTTESEFIASAYGDYRLFFKHSDVYLRP